MASEAQARVHSAIPVNPFTASPRQHLRAVVADDLPHMLDFMAAVVEIEGRAEVVATATNGIGAIRAALRFVPDVVFLDVHMPLMNGFEAAAHIKRRLPRTKVLLVSSDDDAEMGMAALDCGADGFMWKGSFVHQCRKQMNRMFSEAR